MRRGAIAFVVLMTAACGGGADAPASSFDGGGAPPSSSGGGLAMGDDGGSARSFGPAGDGGATSTTNEPSVLTAIVRDFKLYDANDPTTDPDFENVPKTDGSGNPDPSYAGPWDDRGIVAATLGADGKPVYAHAGATTLTTHGSAAFDAWYHDVAGTNLRVEVPIALSANPDGSVGYASTAFFPIDDGTPYATAFGDQGDPHDYSFTVEMHTRFTYRGGEYFNFRGDDDVWVFIDGKRVIDVGGIHGPEDAQVSVDSLGLAKGTEYALDFFSAERHKTGSNVLFETSLDLRPAPPVK